MPTSFSVLLRNPIVRRWTAIIVVVTTAVIGLGGWSYWRARSIADDYLRPYRAALDDDRYTIVWLGSTSDSRLPPGAAWLVRFWPAEYECYGDCSLTLSFTGDVLHEPSSQSIELLRSFARPPLIVSQGKCPAGTATREKPVDVNSADFAELMTLPGIGRREALQIIENRRETGPCLDLSELTHETSIHPSVLPCLEGVAVAVVPE